MTANVVPVKVCEECGATLVRKPRPSDGTLTRLVIFAKQRFCSQAAQQRTPHGNAGKYKNGCRCAACTKANTVRFHEEQRARAARGVPEGVVHGVSTYNNWMCRCEVCTAANSKACHDRRARRSAS